MPPRGRSSPSLLLNLPLLILLLSIFAFLLCFFFLAIPSFFSFSSTHTKLRPNTVKKSWDSLNVFLVLFAIICGIFARRNDEESAPNRNVLHGVHDNKEDRHPVSNHWFDQLAAATPAAGMRRLKRSSSSYPDLRQESFWEYGDDRSRFFDDFEISKYRSSASSEYNNIYHGRQRSVFEESNVKEIPVDPPPPPGESNHKQRRTCKTVPRKEKATRPERKYWSKKTNATTELKMALISFYHQSKRKKKQKSKSLYDDTLHYQPESPSFVTPPQAPSRRRNSTTTGRPPLPTRANNNSYEENVNSQGQSPLIPMPPPPPPPPFRVPGFKFTVKGDYVKIRSAHSSRCSSPELEEQDKQSTETVNMMEGGDGSGGSVFCPSPDVNAKADTFIARLRGEWRLEKINSMKEKRSVGP
ncbi:hypothetical protein GH714_001428 [Hevea brasiliensis]|uniref:Uncharacterized protein n=1 Tax=Hevea brasiliensis TaxID=3981 RepID=A0A6A6LSY8_HEVBR|nr:hypothetical protein GH714_001428 [Hevea brasiliensis]